MVGDWNRVPPRGFPAPSAQSLLQTLILVVSPKSPPLSATPSAVSVTFRQLTAPFEIWNSERATVIRSHSWFRIFTAPPIDIAKLRPLPIGDVDREIRQNSLSNSVSTFSQPLRSLSAPVHGVEAVATYGKRHVVHFEPTARSGILS